MASLLGPRCGRAADPLEAGEPPDFILPVTNRLLNQLSRRWLQPLRLVLLLLASSFLSRAETVSHRADGSWLMDWLVLDRYVAPAEQPQVLADFFALPEGTLQAGQAWSSAEGQPAVWRRMRAPGDTFPVRSMLGREYSGKCGFLACELQSEDAGDAEFRLQSGLDVTLWLNGRELKRGGVLHHAQFAGPSTWSTLVLTGQLRAGTNRLLARVDQLGLAPGFALRVLPPRRAVLTGKVLDAHGKLIRRAVTIAVFQGEREIERIGIDDSGTYHLSLLLERDEPCDIAFTAGEQGCWWLAERLEPGERRVRDATLQPRR